MNIERLKEYLREHNHIELLTKINEGYFDDPIPKLSRGDVVVHKDKPQLGQGVVLHIAKSGLRAYVDFGKIPDWDKHKLNWKPYPAYYLLTKLKKQET